MTLKQTLEKLDKSNEIYYDILICFEHYGQKQTISKDYLNNSFLEAEADTQVIRLQKIYINTYNGSNKETAYKIYLDSTYRA